MTIYSKNKTKMSGEEIISIITEEIKKSEIIDTIKNDKNFEKKVKDIVANTLTDFFKALYQHNSLFKNLVKYYGTGNNFL